MLGRSAVGLRAALAIAGLGVMLCSAVSVSGQSRTQQLRPRSRLGRDKALDVLAYFRPGLTAEEMEKLDFDKSIGFFKGWDPWVAVLCIKDDELKFPGERAPVFLFVTALDLKDYDHGQGFGSIGRGIYAAVSSGADDHLSVFRFRSRGTRLRKIATKKYDLSRPAPSARYLVQPSRDGSFTLHMFVGDKRYEWVLLEPNPQDDTGSKSTTPSRR